MDPAGGPAEQEAARTPGRRALSPKEGDLRRRPAWGGGRGGVPTHNPESGEQVWGTEAPTAEGAAPKQDGPLCPGKGWQGWWTGAGGREPIRTSPCPSSPTPHLARPPEAQLLRSLGPRPLPAGEESHLPRGEAGPPPDPPTAPHPLSGLQAGQDPAPTGKLEFEPSSSIRQAAHRPASHPHMAPWAVAPRLTPCWALSLRPWSPAARSPCCHSLRSSQGIPSSFPGSS